MQDLIDFGIFLVAAHALIENGIFIEMWLTPQVSMDGIHLRGNGCLLSAGIRGSLK